jgi:hypothetical protein
LASRSEDGLGDGPRRHSRRLLYRQPDAAVWRFPERAKVIDEPAPSEIERRMISTDLAELVAYDRRLRHTIAALAHALDWAS